MRTKIKISNKNIQECFEKEPYPFPKYTTQIINLANQNAQATRPERVGQMTELVKAFPGKTLDEWEKWYFAKYPDAFEVAKKRILDMVGKLKKAIEIIDEDIVEAWLRDLLLKTILGLKYQEAILKKGAELKTSEYRSATPEEESRGIDGLIGDIPVSIKPATYKQKAALSENIDVAMIYYEEVKGGIIVDYAELFSE
jgi:hypothetical protein